VAIRAAPRCSCRCGFVSAYQVTWGCTLRRHVTALAWSRSWSRGCLRGGALRRSPARFPIKAEAGECGGPSKTSSSCWRYTAAFTVAYVRRGGIKAVVWTDFLQMSLSCSARVAIAVRSGQVGARWVGHGVRGRQADRVQLELRTDQPRTRYVTEIAAAASADHGLARLRHDGGVCHDGRCPTPQGDDRLGGRGRRSSRTVLVVARCSAWRATGVS